jgi:hypothetical protein
MKETEYNSIITQTNEKYKKNKTIYFISLDVFLFFY